MKIKKWYVEFLEKEERNIFEILFFFILYPLRFIYETIVYSRNFLYDYGIVPQFSPSKTVISIGNISWGGGGKTTLAIYLYERLAQDLKTAILRRGYGDDENKLLEERKYNLFASPDRVNLVKKLSGDFDVFLLDDGFQYRKLKRDLDIVVMGSRELKGNRPLIPQGIFRETINSLDRADILIINYKNEIENIEEIKRNFLKKFSNLKIYCSQYYFKNFLDGQNNEVPLNLLKNERTAALSAIGYPQGFFNILKELKLNVVKSFIFPDHYVLKEEEFIQIEESIIKEGINYLIITHKDKYHLPQMEMKIKVLITKVEMKIENEEDFLEEVKKRLI